MKKFLVISAIALAALSAFCAGTKKFGKMKDSDWVVTNAWQAMQHRVKPDSEWATNHFGSAEFSNAVGRVQIPGGGGGCDTNAVDALANSAVVTNALTVATTNRVALLETANNNLSFSVSDLESSVSGLQSSVWGLQSSKLDSSDVVAPSGDSREGQAADAKVVRAELDSIINMASEAARDASTALYDVGETRNDLNSVRLTAEDALWAAEILETNKADRSMISATNSTFSNAVLAVGLNIDTNSVAVLNDIAKTFGGFPLGAGETATTVGGLLAALAAAVAWLKKNKVQTLKLNDNSIETSADGGVAKLDDFFTESNSLLNGRLAYSRNETGLKDRAFNTLSFDGTEYNLSTALAAVTPTANGQPRDLLIVATATAATTISFTAGTIKGDKPTIDGAGTWLITLTEYAANTWYCRQIKMEDAA